MAEASITSFYTNMGFTPPAFTTTTVSTAGADITKPAGAVIGTTPAPGAVVTTAPATVALSVNPDPLPVVVLTPLPWETGSQYASRMANLGVRVSLIEVGSPVSTYGPDEVLAPADVPSGSTTWTVVPGQRLVPTTTLTVPINPSTATPPVGDPNPPSETSPVIPTTGTCNCTFDITPLQGIGLGSKFPFGVFSYFSTVIGEFNVTPHAPDFNMTAAATGVGGTNLSAPYDVNLGDSTAGHVGSTLDTYMGYWRDLLSFILWVGAIWLVSTKLLGFNAGGDVTGGMDDGDPFV